MKLPNAGDAIVAEEKITKYLLALSHVEGGSKASFFLRFGFASEHWKVLADALRQHARDNEIIAMRDTPYGTRYTVDGPIRSPDGRDPEIRVGWFIRSGETMPRLATAVPLHKGGQR
ncbi:MAG: DUF6883 domain-containing protein [Thermomicrobiales bacterium]